MLLLYRCVVFAAEGLLLIIGLFHRRVALLLKARREGLAALKHARIPEDSEVWWFHCASLGEYEQARPVMQALKKSHANRFIALSFFSPSGYFPAKQSKDADLVFCLPADTPANNRMVLRILKPHAAVWVKYDFWFGYLDALHRRHISLYIISAVFRNNHFLFRFPGRLFLPILKKCRFLFTQDERSARILNEQGFTRVLHAGDTRFDRAVQLREQTAPVPMAEVFRQESLLVVAGSCWQTEESLLHGFIAAQGIKNWRLILVPHDVSEAHIQSIMEQYAEVGIRRWSEFKEADPGIHVLVVDSIGLLSRLYRYAHIAVIGGGYRGALHNILEAATFGMPVLFGPETKKHWEAAASIESGCGFQPADAHEFNSVLNSLLTNEAMRRKASLSARNFIEEHAGATDIIMKHILVQGHE
ncbi:MAG: 3-deoxy-D-manno-octulosonic acid transferase [Bacteroidetes bacterium]|nr:3-deoxy-D-manno-octulosonic acid transferase [Bacteroidota bacterium]